MNRKANLWRQVMQRNIWRIPLVLAAMALLVSTVVGCQSTASANSPTSAGSPTAEGATSTAQGTAVGNIAPDFTLAKLDGSKVRLSELRGQPVVINFWATWCPPCRDELPIIERVYAMYRDKGLTVLAVDLQEDSSTVQQFVTQKKMSTTVVLDSQGMAARLYRVNAVPSTYFIDKDGIIRAKQIGGMSQSIMTSGVEAALKGGSQ